MKLLDEDALANIAGEELVHAAAWKFIFPDTEEEGDGLINLWTGYGDISFLGDTYRGVGEEALIVPTASSIGGANDGLTIEVSSLDPDTAALVDNTDYHQKPVVFYRLIFAPDRVTLLGWSAFLRGRVDAITVSETVGGKASLQVQIEGPRRDMNRRGSRSRSHADQRALGGDAGMKHIGVAKRKKLSWGNSTSEGGSLSRGIGSVLRDAGWIPGQGF